MSQTEAPSAKAYSSSFFLKAHGVLVPTGSGSIFQFVGFQMLNKSRIIAGTSESSSRLNT